MVSEPGAEDAAGSQVGLLVEVIAPTRTAWSGRAVFCVLPGASGEIGVLAGHAPLATLLSEGSVRITDRHGKRYGFKVTGGFAFVNGDHVSVLVDAFEPLPQAQDSQW